MNTLCETLTATYPFLRVKLCEGPGFRVNDWDFARLEGLASADCVRHACSAHELIVEQAIQRYETGLSVTVSLHNRASTPLSGIDRLELVHLDFSLPLSQWQLRYALGGTAESYYPPAAFSTRDTCRIREPHGSAPFQIQSHPSGRSSELHLPLLLALLGQREDAQGLWCGMEWSGEWHIRVCSRSHDGSSLELGVKVEGLTLEVGETLEMPAVHLGFYEGGFVHGTNALRRHVLRTVCPPRTLPALTYNHWFGIGTAYDVALLKKQAARASTLGLEYFVIDSSWFEGGFPKGLGNWGSVDRSKFPQGLKPFSEYVHDLGMGFGLWFEPERAMPGSEAVIAHPELFVEVHEGNHPGHWTKDYFLINLSLPEARRYVIDMLSGYVRELHIDWIRWDYNSHLPTKVWSETDRSGKTQIAYYRGLYEIWDQMMRAFPHLAIEQCAGGGRRIDLGTVRRSHAIWISDETFDPCCCRYMQARANRFLPGHLLNSSIEVPLGAGDARCDDTAILSRMLGKLELSGDIAGWSETLSHRVALWIAEYKQVRHLVSQDFHPLLPQPSCLRDWDAIAFASYSGDEALVFAFRGSGGPRHIRLPLDSILSAGAELRQRRLPLTLWEPVDRDRGRPWLSAALDALEGGAWHLVAR